MTGMRQLVLHPKLPGMAWRAGLGRLSWKCCPLFSTSASSATTTTGGTTSGSNQQTPTTPTEDDLPTHYSDLNLHSWVRVSGKKTRPLAPIQARVWGPARQGRDIFIVAPPAATTTLAYLLPPLQKLSHFAYSNRRRKKRFMHIPMLIIQPSQALVKQTVEEIRTYVEPGAFHVQALFQNHFINRSAAKKRNTILVSTPRFLVNLLENTHFPIHDANDTDKIERLKGITLGDLLRKQLRYLVVNGEDGFLKYSVDHLETLLSRLPPNRQTFVLAIRDSYRTQGMMSMCVRQPVITIKEGEGAKVTSSNNQQTGAATSDDSKTFQSNQAAVVKTEEANNARTVTSETAKATTVDNQQTSTVTASDSNILSSGEEPEIKTEESHDASTATNDDDDAKVTSPNESYVRVPTNVIVWSLVHLVTHLQRLPGSKVAVVFPTTGQTQFFGSLMSKRLGIHVCMSGPGTSDTDALEFFARTPGSVFVTKDSGVDFARATDVIHVGVPSNLDQHQRRLPKGANSILILTPPELPFVEHDLANREITVHQELQDLVDQQDLPDWLESSRLELVQLVRNDDELKKEMEEMHKILLGSAAQKPTWWKSPLDQNEEGVQTTWQDFVVDLANEYARQVGLWEVPSLSRDDARGLGLEDHLEWIVRERWEVGRTFEVGSPLNNEDDGAAWSGNLEPPSKSMYQKERDKLRDVHRRENDNEDGNDNHDGDAWSEDSLERPRKSSYEDEIAPMRGLWDDDSDGEY